MYATNWDDNLPPPKHRKPPKNANWLKPIVFGHLAYGLCFDKSCTQHPHFDFAPDSWLCGKPVGGAVVVDTEPTEGRRG